jgi:hypothetical protein
MQSQLRSYLKRDIGSASEVFLFEIFLRVLQENPNSGIYISFVWVAMEIVFGEDYKVSQKAGCVAHYLESRF